MIIDDEELLTRVENIAVKAAENIVTELEQAGCLPREITLLTGMLLLAKGAAILHENLQPSARRTMLKSVHDRIDYIWNILEERKHHS